MSKFKDVKAIPDQVLKIVPEKEIKFKGPFTESNVTSCLTLTNPSDKNVYFKIKTTTPKRYTVRPNAGMLKPGHSVVVDVDFIPYPFDPDTPPEFWSNHKFMVQSLFEPNGIFDIDQLWRDVESKKIKSMETRIVCGFEISSRAYERNSPTSSSLTGIPVLIAIFIFGFMLGRKWGR